MPPNEQRYTGRDSFAFLPGGQKLRCCRHPAGGKQQSTGLLHLDGSSPLPCEARNKRGDTFGYLPAHFLMDMVSQFCELRSHIHGLSHGLKTCHRHVFTPVCALVPPFRVPSRAKHEIKEEIPLGISSFIWYTGRDSNPQPSEPESDALSIEPPVHASQPCYYSNLFPVCKGENKKLSRQKTCCFPKNSVV